jgi:hypothetical protein
MTSPHRLLAQLNRKMDQLEKLAEKRGFAQPEPVPNITMVLCGRDPLLGSHHWAHEPQTDTLHFTLRLDNKS